MSSSIARTNSRLKLELMLQSETLHDKSVAARARNDNFLSDRSWFASVPTVMTALFFVACHRHLQNRSLSQMT